MYAIPEAVMPSPPGLGSSITVGGRSRRSTSPRGRRSPRREQPAHQFSAAGKRPITNPQARARRIVAHRRWDGEYQLVGAPVQVLRSAVVNPRQPEQLLASVGPASFLCQFAKPVRQLSIVFAGRGVVGIIGHVARSGSAQRINARLKGILQREQRDGKIRGGQLGSVTSALGSSCILTPSSRRTCEPAHI
jgi:hypothetical protein